MQANGTARVGFSMLAALLLVGCGGTSSDSQQTYILQKAMAGLVASGFTANVTIAGSAMVNGTMTPFSGLGTFTATPAVTATFNNGTALAQTQTISGTITAAGQTQTYSSSLTTEHAPGPGGFLGEIVGGEYDVAQTSFAYPTMVTTTTLVLGTLSRYSDSTLSLSLGTIQVSVKVVMAPVDPGSPEQVQFMFQIYDTAQSLMATATFNYNLTSTSVLSFAAAAAQNASGSLTVTVT